MLWSAIEQGSSALRGTCPQRFYAMQQPASRCCMTLLRNAVRQCARAADTLVCDGCRMHDPGTWKMVLESGIPFSRHIHSSPQVLIWNQCWAQDPETKEMMLESGALVLSDQQAPFCHGKHNQMVMIVPAGPNHEGWCWRAARWCCRTNKRLSVMETTIK